MKDNCADFIASENLFGHTLVFHHHLLPILQKCSIDLALNSNTVPLNGQVVFHLLSQYTKSFVQQSVTPLVSFLGVELVSFLGVERATS